MKKKVVGTLRKAFGHMSHNLKYFKCWLHLKILLMNVLRRPLTVNGQQQISQHVQQSWPACYIHGTGITVHSLCKSLVSQRFHFKAIYG